jgi:stage V sporulation protein AF
MMASSCTTADERVPFVPYRLAEVEAVLHHEAGLRTSFDALFREMAIDGVRIGLFYYNGFMKDDVMGIVLARLSSLSLADAHPREVVQRVYEAIPHMQVKLVHVMHEALHAVSAGATALFVEGAGVALTMDIKSYPQRNPEESSIERVVRGSRDGFIETMLTNVTLLRRRVRDAQLRIEAVTVGTRTRTDVAIAYIADIADPKLIALVRDKLAHICVDGIAMADKELEEAMIGTRWNPFPTVRYTERPDVATAHVLEGHVCLFVDTSPSVMVLPTTFFHHIQHAEESRQTPFIGTYLRWVRFFGIWASIFLLPLWFLFVAHPELRPEGLDFLGPQQTGRIPLIAQFLFVEIGVDLMRLAAIHTPTPLATAMGLVAAILIGDVAIKAGLLINEVILYMAVAAIGMFATPSYELGLANRVMRIALLLLVGIWGIPGLVWGTTLVLLLFIAQRSFHMPYFWPLVPFHPRALLDIVLRRPFLAHHTRMIVPQSQDRTRMPRVQS